MRTLEKIRKDFGLDLDIAARKTMTTKRKLTSWESGDSYPNEEEIMNLCSGYGVEYDEIFFT